MSGQEKDIVVAVLPPHLFAPGEAADGKESEDSTVPRQGIEGDNPEHPADVLERTLNWFSEYLK